MGGSRMVSRSAAHKLRNGLQTLLLMLGMAATLGGSAFLVFGLSGLLAAVGILAVSYVLTGRLPKEGLLRLYRAQKVQPGQFDAGLAIVDELTRRAELPRAPELYVVPSEVPNAFAVGHPDNSAVALTIGLMRLMNLREVSGVLAHEVAHVENGDLRVMGLADAMTRVARALSVAGVVLLAVGVASSFLSLFGGALSDMTADWRFWLAIPLLIFAPTVMTLAQLALSRTREFDADHDGAMLSGDPMALASALSKLDNRRGRFWEDILMPGRRTPQPSVLRTHPPTEERIARLRALVGRTTHPPLVQAAPEPEPAPQRMQLRVRRPRFDVLTGVWY